MTDEQLSQIKQWYADPIRKLPRKVIRDVADLVAEVERLKARPGLIGVDLAKQLAKTPAGAGAIVGALVGGVLGAGLTADAFRLAAKVSAESGEMDLTTGKTLCGAHFIASADYKGSPTDRVTDKDIRCTKLKGHVGLHCHEPWKKDFR